MRKIYLAYGIFLLVVCSCEVLMTKESYLKRYDTFITEVSKNYKTFNDKDWAKAIKKYEKFSGKWHEKFKDDFTIKEKITLASYKVKFNFYALKQSNDIKQLFETLKVDEIKAQIQYYLDNNMHDDLMKFIDEAQKVGKEAGEVITSILKGLEININEIHGK